MNEGQVQPPAVLHTDDLKPLTAAGAECYNIMLALAYYSGNRSACARFLGVTRQTLLNKIKKYNLETKPACRPDHTERAKSNG